MSAVPKCSIIKYNSSGLSASIGAPDSLLRLGHAALLCEGDFIINGKLRTNQRVYLSVFGGSKSCSCELDYRSQTHCHNEQHDKELYGCDINGSDPKRFERVDLYHSAINCQKIVDKIIELRVNISTKNAGWHVQVNCLDFVVFALRAGIQFSLYSLPLFVSLEQWLFSYYLLIGVFSIFNPVISQLNTHAMLNSSGG
jgi:hypothetical protein